MSRLSLGVVMCAVLAAPALADPSTFGFGGHLTDVSGTLMAPFQDAQVGDPFEISYVFESTAPDMDLADPNIGMYAAVSTFQVKIGTAVDSWATAPPFDMIAMLPDMDRYGARMALAPIDAIVVIDFEAGAIEDDSLALTLPWEQMTNGAFAFLAGGSAAGDITTWVPEPSSLGLLALISSLVLRRRHPM